MGRYIAKPIIIFKTKRYGIYDPTNPKYFDGGVIMPAMYPITIDDYSGILDMEEVRKIRVPHGKAMRVYT